MEAGRPSWTAINAAMIRAAHLVLDADPKIFEDPLALGLSGFENEAALRHATETRLAEAAQRSSPAFAQRLFLESRGFAVMRHRYTEDALHQAVARGVRQYMILGAGLDSFAYRQPAWATGVHVFEVDYPASQHWKQARLHELAIDPPPTLTFIPIDFEQHDLTATLQAAGYRPEEPAFFSWLGVTPYLTEASVFTTLHAVAAAAAGSEIVFEYCVPASRLDAVSRQALATVQASSAAHGEPWQSLFAPESLAARVRALGFSVVEDFGPDDALGRYFAGRTDGLGCLRLSHLMTARVGEAASSAPQ